MVYKQLFREKSTKVAGMNHRLRGNYYKRGKQTCTGTHVFSGKRFCDNLQMNYKRPHTPTPHPRHRLCCLANIYQGPRFTLAMESRRFYSYEAKTYPALHVSWLFTNILPSCTSATPCWYIIFVTSRSKRHCRYIAASYVQSMLHAGL